MWSVRGPLTQRAEEVAQLGAVDQTVLLLVEDAESLDEVVDRRRVAIPADGRQNRQESLETDPEICETRTARVHESGLRYMFTIQGPYA